MKFRFKIFSIFLSIMIAFVAILKCNLTVYASEGVYPPGTTTLEKVIEEATHYVGYLGCRLMSLYNGDFGQWVQNKDDFIQWWNTGHISVSEDVDGSGSPGIVFDEDLTAYMKQALIEYAEETNGFKIYPTIDYMSLSPSIFASNYTYGTFCNLVRQYGCIDVETNFLKGDTLYVSRPFHDITSDSVSLVSDTKYGDYIVQAKFYGTNIWQLFYAPVKIFRTVSYDADYIAHYTSYKSWNEGTDFTDR